MDDLSIEWDEAKRSQTLTKHGIDFIDAATIFLAPHIVLEARSDIEERRIAVGVLDGIVVSVVFTRRAGSYRIITARRARANEREHYQALLAGRVAPAQGRN